MYDLYSLYTPTPTAPLRIRHILLRHRKLTLRRVRHVRLQQVLRRSVYPNNNLGVRRPRHVVLCRFS